MPRKETCLYADNRHETDRGLNRRSRSGTILNVKATHQVGAELGKRHPSYGVPSGEVAK